MKIYDKICVIMLCYDDAWWRCTIMRNDEEYDEDARWYYMRMYDNCVCWKYDGDVWWGCAIMMYDDSIGWWCTMRTNDGVVWWVCINMMDDNENDDYV